MNTEITILTNDKAMAAVRHEIMLEQQFKSIGLAFDINLQMIGDGKYQQFTKKYSTFSNTEPTPYSFAEIGSHIQKFISQSNYVDEKETNAGIWVISRIWKKKYEANAIFDTEINVQYKEIYQAKKEKTEIHKAVGKLAKDKPLDSFEAGLAANLKDLMKSTGCNQLKKLITEAEVVTQLENIKQLSGVNDEAA